jgi:hypothetical protein
MSVVVAIPSYNRVETLEKKTLNVLHKYKIAASRIYIFVANEEEKKRYETLPKELYGHIIVAEKGLMNARNFITEYFPENKPILQMDDDIEGLYELADNKLVPLESLANLINKGFELCKTNNMNLWGIAPVHNSFYLKPNISTNAKFIIGHFWGVINKKCVEITMDFKEDYERSLKFIEKDGGVIRFNYVAAKTRLGAKGGLDKTAKERLEINKINSDKLVAEFPNLVRLNPRRPGEILIRQFKGTTKPTIDERKDTRITYIKIRDKAKFKETSKILLEALDKITVPKLADNNRSEILGTEGRSMTFGYGYKIAASPGSYRWNFKKPDVFDALVAFGNTVVPLDWEYDSITLNHNMVANKHLDVKNVGLSVIIGIGDYTGGELKVWNASNTKSKAYSIHDKPLMFNGGLLYHEGTPFNNNRYTMVFYKQNYKGVKDYTMKGE